jgi:hypothetical protein
MQFRSIHGLQSFDDMEYTKKIIGSLLVFSLGIVGRSLSFSSKQIACDRAGYLQEELRGDRIN